MTFKKRNKLQIIKIGILSIILLVFVAYYITANFFRKNSSENEHDFSSVLSDGIITAEFLKQRLLDSKTEAFNGEKLVHLDLKGAPPLLSYFKEFFPFIKKAGATGILIEYEDMFFYKNELENIRAHNAYQPSVIREILDLAELNDLLVIPLVQTFGHLEFVLKLGKFKDFREVKQYPQVLCPSHERVLFYIKKMIDQILEAHPKVKYIHIGCDEVMFLGECDRCKSAMHENFWTTAQLFLNHVKSVAMYINETYPGVRPIIWGDMINKFNERIIKKSQISSLVDLMVWKYDPMVSKYISDDLLGMYSRIFKSIWIASAFKGATGAHQMRTDVMYHLANNVAWLKLVNKWKNQIDFKGIAITGWQRYDHFTELCELLPVGIPSLASSLFYLNNPETGVNESEIVKILQCNPATGFSLFRFQYFLRSWTCDFPGFLVYQLINKFYFFSIKVSKHFSVVYEGWFSVYNILHNFGSPSYVNSIFYKWPLNENLKELKELEEDLKKALSEVYDEFTVSEWITTYVTPIKLRLEAFYMAKEAMLGENVWPKRPFMNNTDGLERAAREICSNERNFGCALLMT